MHSGVGNRGSAYVPGAAVLVADLAARGLPAVVARGNITPREAYSVQPCSTCPRRGAAQESGRSLSASKVRGLEGFANITAAPRTSITRDLQGDRKRRERSQHPKERPWRRKRPPRKGPRLPRFVVSDGGLTTTAGIIRRGLITPTKHSVRARITTSSLCFVIRNAEAKA